ncbi:Abi-alpha family protein [Empedobacter sp. GD03739]|uniref:Abi-alpha family protein n=1 Tax=Empedobacter sp. GD03739 TaxID=2975376 RepID=UPI0024472C24|nr:Abi-alpha family protein [Empedobacter sp. GD03739]MDH1604135.1 DUF4393 domain-containing protein [Empedobacter sp. GD03739]
MKITGDLVNSEPIKSLTIFFSEIVGKPLIDGAGILYGDALKARRIANTLKLENKYNLVKANDTKPTELSFGYKLLEKASIEEDENLLEKWANLLANATDKNFNSSIRKIFIETLDSLEPLDVQIFDDINKFCISQPHLYNTLVSLREIDYNKKESLNVLLSLGLITYGVTITPGIQIGGHAPTTFHGLDSFKVTEMGQSFYKAVTR